MTVAYRVLPITRRSIMAMMLREIATSYGRSPGGYFWAVAEPVAAIALLAAVFSIAFDRPSLGLSFPLFYASGYLPFVLFNDLVNKIASAIRFSRPLLAYPVVSWLDAVLARFALNLITHLVVFLLVIIGIEVLFDTGAIYDPSRLGLALCMAAALGLGLGTLNCYLLMRFPLWDRLWQIATRPLFVISGIFFVLEDLPRTLQDTAWWNPLIHVTGALRSGVYASYDATYVSPAFVFAVALTLLTLGLALLFRNHRDILNNA